MSDPVLDAKDTEKENPISLHVLHPSFFPLFFHFGSMAKAEECSLAFIVSLCVNNNATCYCTLQFTKCFHQRYAVKML